MKELKVDKKLIINRLGMIEKYLARLEDLKKLSQREFAREDKYYFDTACYNLRSALEAIFDIGGHIVSRKPGGVYESYADIALKLGEQKIIPKKFAENNLSKMARYRNRLTHLYLEVKPKETYEIIQNNLNDVEAFLKYIKKFITTAGE